HAPTLGQGGHHLTVAVRPGLMDEPLPPQGNLEEIPHSRAGFLRSLQLAGFPGNRLKTRRQSRAIGATLQVCLQLYIAAFIEEVRQFTLKLCTGHTTSPQQCSRFTACARSSRLSGLFGSARFEEVAQLHPRLVQLRLAVSNRTTHHRGNLVVLIS